MNDKFIYKMTDINLKSLKRRILDARCRKHKPISEIKVISSEPIVYWDNKKLMYDVSENKYIVTMTVCG